MKRFYDAIYLSAHLDDVVLSCGGQIYQRVVAGEAILIVTVTAGDPTLNLSTFAAWQHKMMGLGQNPVAIRRREDQAACAILGADCLHWDVLDCIYRQHPETGEALYVSNEAIFGRIHAAETPLISAIADRIAQLPTCGQLFAPLALGDHVDHWLARFSAEKHAHPHLTYYEDYPYSQRLGDKLTVNTDRLQLQQISPIALDKRIEAIAAYASQVDLLFGSSRKMKKLVRTYATEAGGERIFEGLHA